MTTPDVIARSDDPSGAQLPRLLDWVPVAIFGLAAAAAIYSAAVPWQTTTLDGARFGGEQQQDLVLDSPLAVTGAVGTAYLVAMVLLVGVSIVALLGRPPVRHTARLIGFGLAGAAAAIAGVMIFQLKSVSTAAALYGASPEANQYMTVALKPGAWAGLAAAVLALLALALTAMELPAREPFDDYDDDDEPAYGEGIEVIDMTVKAG
jgi:hypothetical protein